MKIEADRAALAAALGWAALAVPKRPTMPALAGIKLVAADGQITAQAFDGDVGHTVLVDASVGEPGEVLVSGRFLAMIVDGFRAEKITLEIDGPNLVMKSGRSTYRARTMRLGDFPPLPSFGKTIGSVEADELVRLLRVTSGPIDDAAERQATAGLHLEGNGANEDPRLWAVGTDDQAHSLHVCAGTWSHHKKAKALDVTIPVASFAAAVRGMSGKISLGLDGPLLSLKDKQRTVTFRPFASDYLGGKWRKLLESEAAAVAEVNRDEFAAALARAASLGDETVGIKIEPDELTIIGGTDIGDGVDIIEASFDSGGASVEFGMSTSLMSMALAAHESERVTINVPTLGKLSRKPLDVRPAGRDDERCLVMPRERKGLS